MEQRSVPRGHRGRRVAVRVLVGLLSAVVLLASGIGWRLLRDLSGGISTSDVILGGSAKSAGTDLNVLLVGVDSRTDAQGRPLSRQVLAQLRSGAEEGVLNSDTIILLHVPADGSRATGISIPRDSYVTIPGYDKNKINSAYPAATNDAAAQLRAKGADAQTVERESRTAGRQELIKTVENLTGVKIDHYAEVNLLGFFNLTQAIGGVDVCLKNAVSEPKSGADFPAGRQTISGGAALAFVRQRYGLPQSDFSRIRRQQVFLAAVAHKILSAGTLSNPAKLQGLIEAAQQSVVLDSGWDVLSFARQASNLAGGNIEFMTIPTAGEATTAEHGDVVLVDPDQVRAFVHRQFGGSSAAAPPGSARASDDAEAVPPSQVTVDVRNGTGRGGLAGQVAKALAKRGYQEGQLDNIDEPSSSTVHYPPGHSDAGDQVAKVLGGLRTVSDDAVPSGTVRVYLAPDFSLSDIRSSGASASARSSAPAPPPAPPITADGVPCVD